MCKFNGIPSILAIRTSLLKPVDEFRKGREPKPIALRKCAISCSDNLLCYSGLDAMGKSADDAYETIIDLPTAAYWATDYAEFVHFYGYGIHDFLLDVICVCPLF